MTDQRREERIYSTRSTYMHYIHTTDMARRHERQKQLAQLDEEIRRNEAMMLKRQRDSRMHTEQAIRELRLEKERRRIKEEQRQQEHEERRRICNQNKKQLERELERIKKELRAELAKEEIKCHSSDDEEKCQEKKETANMSKREECRKQIEDFRQIAAVELERREHEQRNSERMAPAAGQIHVHEIIQDEIEEKEHRKNTETENKNETCMVNDETSDEKRETEVQTGYRKKINEDSLINVDTPQKDCICISMPYDQLNNSCAQITTMEVLQNTNRQKIPVDHTLGVCITQECVSDDIIQSDSAHAGLSDEKLQLS